ncbi:MAG: sigma-54-dependent Fis family transcriptional regulator [Acidobacteriota bacterium]|nr:MAG: sigma-54-dependent Fis family transcriptional regulator [Acidobacteriota bacterium]
MSTNTAGRDRGAAASGSRPRILVVDDEPAVVRWVELVLGKEGYETESLTGGEAALRRLEADEPDLMLLVIKMPGMSGLEVLDQLRQRHPQLPVIILTGQGTVEKAVSAMKLGARDFLTKPFETERLSIAVRNALELTDLSRRVKELKLQLFSEAGLDQIVGLRCGLRATYSLIEKVIPTDLTVLLQGESGTGKDLFARLIHDEGPRAAAPFVAINCAALPETLLESELFGYEKGAFTGADHARVGKFEAAHGGTLFLDEISEMSAAVQAKLLRTLQEHTVTRLGSTRSRPVDVRVLCATNRNLEQQVESGQFREDLFYRLAVFPVTIPPLRERRDDIPALADHILRSTGDGRARAVHPESMRMLESYHWPGNVRELQNVLCRAVVLAGSGPIEPTHLPSAVRRAVSDAPVPPSALARGVPYEPRPSGESTDRLATLSEMERVHILRCLEACRGNLSQTARTLAIGRTTLYRKLQRYGLQPAPPHGASEMAAASQRS